MFHFVSHDFANFHWTWRFVLFVCWCVGWVSFVFVCVFGLLCFSSENSAFNSRFILSNFQLLTDNVSYSNFQFRIYSFAHLWRPTGP